MQPKFQLLFNRANWQTQMPAQIAPLLLLGLTVLLLVGYQVFPGWQLRFNPVFAALILGLAAALLLGFNNAGQRCLASLAEPAAKQALAFWQQLALRLGIVLFALNISPTALLNIEPWQLLKLLMLVVMVLALALWIGCRWFKLPPELVLLVSAGLSFCGTSAIFATHAVRSSSQNSQSQTNQSAQGYLTQSLAAVLLMGLLALGIYSVLLQQPWLGSADLAWLIGSTAPEVAQAVATGSQLADDAPQAIIAKLSRVCLLLPFLCWLSLLQHKKQHQQDPSGAVVFPWFILVFVGLLLLQLLVTIPAWLQHLASIVSQGCLVFAMLATGLQTRAQDLRQCSLRLFSFAALVMLLLFGLALLML
ncbi:putative sulfate exporter family transporter [Rheinheimera sp. SA_1]|uniref:putative sulfate exporter family transporter n=1 Tax=Rheinheimera sp. SA_1 TaxID=1827365 RepID=UPI0018D3C5A8|nr:putative sulfate exporter family transporter [Rheinheimera sp. SA_1]